MRGLFFPALVLLELLIELHDPDQRKFYVNREAISAIRTPIGGRFPAGTQCVIIMSNGNSIALSDACDAVRRKVEGEGGG